MSEDNRGYATIPVWMVQDPGIRDNVKLMFVLLASYQGERGIFPSQTRLAACLGWSVKTVKRTLNDMREMGLIEVRVEKTTRGRRNNYRLLVDRFGGAMVGVAPSETPPMGSFGPSPIGSAGA